MKVFLKEDKGFTLVELIVVISIIVILVAMLVPNVIGYIEKAHSIAVKEDARQVYIAAQAALVDIKAQKPGLLTDGIDKGVYKGKDVACFSNCELSYNQLNSGNTHPGGLPNNTEDAIAVTMLANMGWSDADHSRYPFRSDAQPFGETVDSYAANNSQPGIVVLYDYSGSVVYMEWGIEGYIVRMDSGGEQISIEKNGRFITKSGSGDNCTFGG